MEEALSIDEALEHIFEHGNGRWTVLVVSVLSINSAVQALESNLLSYLGVCAAVEFGMSAFEQSCLVSAPYVGMILGTLIFTPLADVVGRRQVLLWTTWLLCLSGMISAVAPSFFTLAACRALVGFAEGAWGVSFSLLAEFVPSRNRGLLLNISNISWGLGSTFICAMAWAIIPSLGWRVFTFVAALPVLISAVAMVWLQESPFWLMSEGRAEEAFESISRIASINGCDMPCKRLLCVNEQSQLLTVEQGHLTNEEGSRLGKDYMFYASRMLEEYHMLLSREYRYVTLVACVLWGCWGFAYTGIVLFDSAVLHQPDSSSTCEFDYSFNFVVATAEIVGGFLVMPVIDRTDLGMLGGRVGGQILPFCACALTTYIAGVGAQPLLLWTYASRGLICAASSVSCVHVTELFDTKMRSTGIGAASIANSAAGFIVSYWVFAPYSLGTIAMGFSCACLAAALLVYFIPETAQTALKQ